MITLIKRIAVLLLVTTLLAIVGVGCNTAHGFGKDMEKAGEGIQDATKSPPPVPATRSESIALLWKDGTYAYQPGRGVVKSSELNSVSTSPFQPRRLLPRLFGGCHRRSR
jgi:predicted small secreted protein